MHVRHISLKVLSAEHEVLSITLCSELHDFNGLLFLDINRSV